MSRSAIYAEQLPPTSPGQSDLDVSLYFSASLTNALNPERSSYARAMFGALGAVGLESRRLYQDHHQDPTSLVVSGSVDQLIQAMPELTDDRLKELTGAALSVTTASDRAGVLEAFTSARKSAIRGLEQGSDFPLVVAGLVRPFAAAESVDRVEPAWPEIHTGKAPWIGGMAINSSHVSEFPPQLRSQLTIAASA
jgi:hypothetical protein